jgi:hypothetical protein
MSNFASVTFQLALMHGTQRDVVFVVVLVVGPISTAAMRTYCTLIPQMEFRQSSPEALHTKRRERPLLAKDGTKAKEFR